MTDRHWLPSSAPLPAGWERPRFRRSAHYLPMRDGVRIAVDLFLPEGAAGPVPTIVRHTRYLRALEPRAPLGFAAPQRAFDLYERTRRVFLAAGYAWLDVDVRGSGASTGTQPYPWAMDEILDGGEIAAWIVAQPWSSGKIGSLGISYDGTCADFLPLNAHPAVVAVAPLFSLFDAFADVTFPGGVHLAWFTEVWAAFNRALDLGIFPDAYAPVVRLIARAAATSPAPRGPDRLVAALGKLDRDRFDALVKPVLDRMVTGVAPVGGDRAALARAIAEHAQNYSVHEGAKRIVYRDDRGLSPGAPDDDVDVLSPHNYVDRLRAAGVPVYSYTGWRDGGYPRSAVERHRAVGGEHARLTVGPWLHTGKMRIRPFDVAVPADFDHDAELLAFFDQHTRGKPPAGDGKPVHYYTFVEERWKAADQFPPPFDPTVLHLAAQGRLAEAAPDAEGADAHRIDPAIGTGERSRWRSLFSLVPGDYPDRRERDRRLLTYDSAPLERPLEVTGYPIAAIFASWDEDDDGRLFAYLEDVAPDGRVAYVTEGQLRALHRRVQNEGRRPGEVPDHSFRRADTWPVAAGEVAEIAFAMQPVSWRFERGHRVRLAITGGDADHFAKAKEGTLRVRWGKATPSRIELPVPRT
ncbi:MAG: CocE/NonD family hydrolase [Minicystis sp.]